MFSQCTSKTANSSCTNYTILMLFTIGTPEYIMNTKWVHFCNMTWLIIVKITLIKQSLVINGLLAKSCLVDSQKTLDKVWWFYPACPHLFKHTQLSALLLGRFISISLIVLELAIIYGCGYRHQIHFTYYSHFCFIVMVITITAIKSEWLYSWNKIKQFCK